MPTVSKKTSTPKRIGRPFKAPKKGTRAPLSLLVRPEIKQLVDKRAKASGRTQSQEAEMVIERAFARDELIAAIGTDDSKLTDSVFRRTHVPLHTSHGIIWFPKEHP